MTSHEKLKRNLSASIMSHSILVFFNHCTPWPPSWGISMRKIEKDVRFWGMCDDRLKCATCQHGIHVMWILGAFLHLNILENVVSRGLLVGVPFCEWSKLRRPRSFAVGLATWYQFSLKFKVPPPVEYSTMTRYVTDVTHCSDFGLAFLCWAGADCCILIAKRV